MRRELKAGLIASGLMLVHGSGAFAAPVCVTPIGGTTQKCTIAKAADCDGLKDYPYARDLHCAAAFSAAQAMVADVEKTLGAKAPSEGFFHYYQTLADPVAQTTVACLDTPPPYPAGKDTVLGAGTPLCNLVAYVSSAGPDARKERKDNPIPKDLRSFPEYFGALYAPDKKFALTKFRAGSAFDALVTGLGAGAAEGFTADYKKFSPTKLYGPDKWEKDTRYRGISGGGGSGWGGEIAVVGPQGPVVQFAYGGGGGGGLSSFQPAAGPAHSGLGAGGGGGAQFADGYRFNGKSYNGLGLGAGTGSTESPVEYSYNDYTGSPRPAKPVHEYNAAVIAEYETQLKHLGDQLKAGYGAGKTIVVRGGGGMGAGTAFLQANGQEALPVALSVQGGFQFSYEFRRAGANDSGPGAQALTDLNAGQESIYAFIGDTYRIANQTAFEECGRDYSNFACMCPIQHATVICLVTQHVGDPALVPGWLQQRHCPGDANLGVPNGAGFSSYQQFLLGAASTIPASCTASLKSYFNVQNAAAP